MESDQAIIIKFASSVAKSDWLPLLNSLKSQPYFAIDHDSLSCYGPSGPLDEHSHPQLEFKQPDAWHWFQTPFYARVGTR